MYLRPGRPMYSKIRYAKCYGPIFMKLGDLVVHGFDTDRTANDMHGILTV